MRPAQPDDTHITHTSTAVRKTLATGAIPPRARQQTRSPVSGLPDNVDGETSLAAARPAPSRSRSLSQSRGLLSRAAELQAQDEKDDDTAAPAALLIRPTAPSVRLGGRRKSPARAPRSPIFAVRVFAFVTAAVILLGGGVAASPLGHSLSGLGGFETAANAIAWHPTPTHTPKPSGGSYPAYGDNPGAAAIKAEITSVFGSSYAAGAIRVATCESGLNPNVTNSIAIGNSHAAGVFQILYPSTWLGTSYRNESPFNYHANIRAAYEIFKRDGYTWREWQCQP